MRGVLEGRTYKELAKPHRLSPAAVGNRVRDLAYRMHQAGQIDRLNPEALRFATNLRENKERIEAALERIESEDALSPKAKPRPDLSFDDVQTIIRRAGMRSRSPLRDVALVQIVLATGIRPIEVARLQIQDFLNEDGTVRVCSRMRAKVAFNQRARPLFFMHSGSVKAIEAYLTDRLAKKKPHPASDAPFRGFAPDEFLFLNDVNRPYRLQSTRRDGRVYCISRQLLNTYRRIFTRINMPGISAQTLRRAVAVWLYKRGANENQIGTLLGIADRKNVRDLLPAPPSLAELVADLYPDMSEPSSLSSESVITSV